MVGFRFLCGKLILQVLAVQNYTKFLNISGRLLKSQQTGLHVNVYYKWSMPSYNCLPVQGHLLNIASIIKDRNLRFYQQQPYTNHNCRPPTQKSL